MAGKEVREYTNLSDPKGTHMKLLYLTYDPCSYFCFSVCLPFPIAVCNYRQEVG